MRSPSGVLACYLGSALSMGACTETHGLNGASSSYSNSSAASSAPSPSPSAPGSNNNAGDSATPPQQVTGAYLVGCGDAGADGYACSVTNASTKQPVPPTQLQGVNATVTYNGQLAPDHPQLQPAAATSPWSFSFPVPAAKLPQLSGITISGTIAGAALNQTVTTFTPYYSAAVLPPLASGTAAITVNSDVDLMFLTRQAYTPGVAYTAGGTTFASAADADSICNALAGSSASIVANSKIASANAKTVTRSWVALIGDTAGNAQTHVDSDFGQTSYIQGDIYSSAAAKVVAAGGWTSSYNTYQSVVNTDETGAYVGADAGVWSGTDLVNGNASSCSGWTSGSALVTGEVGNADALGSTNWLSSGTAPCNGAMHLYCMGITAVAD